MISHADYSKKTWFAIPVAVVIHTHGEALIYMQWPSCLVEGGKEGVMMIYLRNRLAGLIAAKANSY